MVGTHAHAAAAAAAASDSAANGGSTDAATTAAAWTSADASSGASNAVKSAKDRDRKDAAAQLACDNNSSNIDGSSHIDDSVQVDSPSDSDSDNQFEDARETPIDADIESPRNASTRVASPATPHQPLPRRTIGSAAISAPVSTTATPAASTRATDARPPLTIAAASAGELLVSRTSTSAAAETTATTSHARPASARSASTPFVPLPPSKTWRAKAMRSNGKLNKLMQAALLKTLLHAIRRGSAEGVKVAIERGVSLQYIDSRSRNLIMLAAKCDTDARLQIVIILCDAGCAIDHTDQLGWSCLHYACASGALDVATELIRRGAQVAYNPYGYGPEDFLIPKVARAKSLLQHTEQLHHEQNVRKCWDAFRTHAAAATGYRVKCRSHCDLGKPLRVTFHAPATHSPLDRIRVIDMNSDVPLWLQVSKSFTIPPGTVGTITLDAETLDRPSLYRIFYEKYEPSTMQLVPQAIAEQSLSIRNLDTGATVAVGAVNDLVLRALSKTTKAATNSKQLSHSSREAPKSLTYATQLPRRMSTTTARMRAAALAANATDNNTNDTQDDDATNASDTIDAEDDDAAFVADETLTATAVAAHPTVRSITGVYKLVSMAIVSVSTLKRVKANEYELTIRDAGAMGLHLEPKRDASSRSTKLIVRRSTGQTAAVNPGDCLVAIGRANIEHAGLKHTLWELNDAARPLVLRFRRGNVRERKSLFASLRELSAPKPLAAIAV